MTDHLRNLLRDTAATAPEPGDLMAGAEEKAATVRRRRTQAVAAGSTLVATVLTLVVAGTVFDGGPGAVDPTVVATAPGSASVPPSSPSLPSSSSSPTGFGPALLTEDFAGPVAASRWVTYSDGEASPLSTFSARESATGPGGLRLTASRSGDTAHPYTTGGIGGGPIAREYGRFAVTMRMTAGFNVVGQVLLANFDTGTPSSLLTVGADRRTGYLVQRGRAGEVRVDLPAPLTAEHVVAVEWSPRLVRWTYDGVELARFTGPSPTGRHFLAVQMLVLGPDCRLDPLPAACPGALVLPQVLTVRGVTIQPYTGR